MGGEESEEDDYGEMRIRKWRKGLVGWWTWKYQQRKEGKNRGRDRIEAVFMFADVGRQRGEGARLPQATSMPGREVVLNGAFREHSVVHRRDERYVPPLDWIWGETTKYPLTGKVCTVCCPTQRRIRSINRYIRWSMFSIGKWKRVFIPMLDNVSWRSPTLFNVSSVTRPPTGKRKKSVSPCLIHNCLPVACCLL